MIEWISDPKSISLVAGALLTAGVSIWQGRQTALIVDGLVRWRLEQAVPAFTELKSNVEHLTDEVNRLRDLRGGR